MDTQQLCQHCFFDSELWLVLCVLLFENFDMIKSPKRHHFGCLCGTGPSNGTDTISEIYLYGLLLLLTGSVCETSFPPASPYASAPAVYGVNTYKMRLSPKQLNNDLPYSNLSHYCHQRNRFPNPCANHNLPLGAPVSF